jgi:hypothetical protein
MTARMRVTPLTVAPLAEPADRLLAIGTIFVVKIDSGDRTVPTAQLLRQRIDIIGHAASALMKSAVNEIEGEG